MISRFKELEKREQQALIFAAVAVCFFILYQFVFHPFSDTLTRQQKEIRYQHELHDWMANAKTKLGTQTTLHHISADNLLSDTTQALKKAHLDKFNYDLQQADNDSVRLAFNQVPYLTFIKWMEAHWSRNALSLQSASMKPTKTPGMVKVSMTFQAT